jgi:glycosyltransferase involved in cell wall biosynthesis
LKIGYFVTHYPYLDENGDYFSGGVGEVALNLAREIAELGHEVFVFTTSKTSKSTFEEYGKIKVYRYGYNFKIAECYISLKLLSGPIMHNLDIVHTHMGNAPAPYSAFIYSILRKKPLVTTYHGDQQDGYGSFLRRIFVFIHNKLFAKRILASSKIVISPSFPFIDESKYLKFFKDKILVIPNGLDLSKYISTKTKEQYRHELGLPHNKIIILFVGALSKYKGPEVLLNSVKIVNENNSNILTIFIGNGQMREELEGLSKDLGVTEVVKFLGYVDENLKINYYKAADIFVLPSTLNTELFPIVLLEASASSLPIVVSDLNTFKCIIKEGFNGIFTKRNDSIDLANSIISLIKNKELLKKMSENSHSISSKFSWDKIAADYNKLYQNINSNRFYK